MKTKFLAVAAFGLAALAACTFVQQKTDQNQNVSGPDTVKESPLPSQGAGSTDVASIAIFRYSTTCDAGVTPPPNGSDKIPAGCILALLTATPKTSTDKDGDGKNDDAVQLNGNVPQWSFSQDPKVVDVVPGESNPAFNREVRTVTPRVKGTFTARVKLQAGGREFAAERTFTVE